MGKKEVWGYELTLQRLDNVDDASKRIISPDPQTNKDYSDPLAPVHSDESQDSDKDAALDHTHKHRFDKDSG